MQHLHLVSKACLFGILLTAFSCAEEQPATIEPSSEKVSVLSPAPREFSGEPMSMQQALDYFGEPYDLEIWVKDQRETLRDGLAAGPLESDASVLEEYVLGHTMVLIEKAESNHLVVVTLLGWDSADAAKRYVEIERILMQAKDSAEKGVESSVYREVNESDLTGFISEKQLRDMFGPYPARSVIVSRGKTIVEVTFLVEEKTDAELLEYARAMFTSLGISAP